MSKSVKMTPLDDFHKECLITMEEFLDNVESDMFIDEDGYGNLATATHVSRKEIGPDDITAGWKAPEWATHVCWYNR